MKTSISKRTFSLRPAFFLLLSFVFCGLKLFPQTNNFINDGRGKKQLEILEKLESGKTISSEEIRASLGKFTFDDQEPADLYIPGIPDMPPFPKIHSFPGPYYYKYHDGRDHIIISDSDLKKIHKRLDENLEELRKNIESFRNSEDFLIIHDELQKWNDNFRNELKKLRDELIKSENESRSKGTVHLLV